MKLLITTALLLACNIVDGRVTMDSLKERLDRDVARQKALPALIAAQQRPIDALNSKLENLKQDHPTMSDDQKPIITAKYQERLKGATNTLNNAINRIKGDRALLADEKKLLITNARAKYQPPIDAINEQIESVKHSSTLSEDQKQIVTTAYRQQIQAKEPALKALQAEYNSMDRKIDEDHKQIQTFHERYEPAVSYDGHDWNDRKNARWDAMDSGRFGNYSEWWYEPVEMGFFFPYYGWVMTPAWKNETGSFSADGKNTIKGSRSLPWYSRTPACNPPFNPRNDSPQQQQELIKLLAEAKYDKIHGIKWMNEQVLIGQDLIDEWSVNLDYQIELLQKRINNES